MLVHRGLNSRLILLTHMVPDYNGKIYGGNYVVITSGTILEAQIWQLLLSESDTSKVIDLHF